MTITINHAFVNPKADGGDTTIARPSDWNAGLVTSMSSGFILGRATAGVGPFEEIPTTGTGNVVMSASPTLSGTVTGPIIFSGLISIGAGSTGNTFEVHDNTFATLQGFCGSVNGGIGVSGIDVRIGSFSPYPVSLYQNAAPAAVIDTSGNFTAWYGLRSIHPTSGLGYGLGAGGTVTQLTSRNTGVTINKVTGDITLFSQVNAAVSAATANTFTVTNSAVNITDTILVNQRVGTDKYMIFVTGVGTGSFVLTFFTTGGTSSEAPVFHFCVLTGENS